MKEKKAGRYFISLICVFLLLTIMPLMGYAAAPQMINYQGYLTDSAGTPVDGTVQITFAIYNVNTGGTALWSETQTVTLSDGIFNVNLGNINPVSLPFDTQYYLGVKVGTDAEMTPRPELTSTSYSFSADEAGYALEADTVDGYHGTDLEESAEIDADIAAHTAVSDSHHLKTTSFSELTDQVSDGQIPAGIARDAEVAVAVDTHAVMTDNPHGVTAAQVGPAVDLNCTGCVSQSELDFSPLGAFTDTGTSAYYTGGNVGIGTTNPTQSLEVFHNIKSIMDNTAPRHGLILENPNGYSAIFSGGDHGSGLAFYTNSATSHPYYSRLFIAENGNVGVRTTMPAATLEIAGNQGGTNGRNFKVTYPGGGNLTGTELSGLAHVGGYWHALYARQGVAGSAAYFDGNVGIRTIYPRYTLHVNGSFSASWKYFDIPDPRYNDETKRLVHATLEGPEHGVYYRGEAILTGGMVTVVLPDYFEALTRAEGRTVILTAKNGWSPLYVEGGVANGKFAVKTTEIGNQEQEFYWEVKAVRADVDLLQTETIRTE